MAPFGASHKSLMNSSATVLFFQLKNGDSDTYIYQKDLMGLNPAHSTHSDQQSVDLFDYIKHGIDPKYLLML